MRKICCIEGCHGFVLKRGWCSKHYWRWYRNGDPVPLARRKARKFYEDIVLQHVGDDCLFWPYAVDKAGYAQMREGGHKRSVHRLACIEVHGEPPTNRHEAAHSCGNGHLGCCAPKHLSWKTPIENAADKIRHGTQVRGESQGSAKLTEAVVRVILLDRGRHTQSELSETFGISKTAVARVQRRITWAHVRV